MVFAECVPEGGEHNGDGGWHGCGQLGLERDDDGLVGHGEEGKGMMSSGGKTTKSAHITRSHYWESCFGG